MANRRKPRWLPTAQEVSTSRLKEGRLLYRTEPARMDPVVPGSQSRQHRGSVPRIRISWRLRITARHSTRDVSDLFRIPGPGRVCRTVFRPLAISEGPAQSFDKRVAVR